MRQLILILVGVFSLSAVTAFADKPQWAGEGGKPSSGEIEQHKEDMRNKNNSKKGKNGKDSDEVSWNKDGDQDKEKEKEKEKEQEKEQEKNKEKNKSKDKNKNKSKVKN